MKQIIKYTLFALLVSGFQLLNAQVVVNEELRQQLQGVKKFSEITRITKNFYQQELSTARSGDSVRLKKINREIKFWRRWEWFNRARLTSNNEITNIEQQNWNEFEKYSNQTSRMQNSTATSIGNWDSLGPTEYIRLNASHTGGLGRVNCIAFHPTNANIIYIGTPAGGLWRTTNEGTTWTALTDHIPSTGISGIVVDYSNTNTIYILTGDGDGTVRASIGVLKSTDGGINWTKTGAFPGTAPVYYGYKLIQDPVNPSTLFAATTEGIYKSVDGGVSWTRPISGDFTDIEFYPGNHNIIYAVLRKLFSRQFYRSFDNGSSFSSNGVTGAPGFNTSGSGRIQIGVSPDAPSKIYLLAGPVTDTGEFRGVYLSIDTGKNFIKQTGTPNILGGATDGQDDRDQAWYDLALAVNPANSNQLIVGGINVWGSVDAALNFVLKAHWIEPDVPASQYVHADIHALAYNPLNNKLFVCSDGGVSKSSDHGTTWLRIWNGLQIMQFYHMTGCETNAELLIGGTQDNGSNYRKNNSAVIYNVLGADGYSSVIDYTNTNIIYCSGNENLHKSTDGGNSETNINPPFPSADISFPMVAMHVTDHNTIFCGKGSNVYRSTNAGGVWTNLGVGGNLALNTCPSNANRIYASDKEAGNPFQLSDNLYRIDGTTATALENNPGYPNNPGLRLTDIAVHPANSDIVCITFGGYDSLRKIFRSTDAGANWTNITGSLPNAATTAIEYDNNGNLYVGTDLGVFYRGSAMTDWVPFYNGLPKSPITDLVINEGAGIITASTFGRGIYRSELYTPCVSSLNLNGTLTGNWFYEASSTINSNQKASGISGTSIIYKAGSSSTLTDGFEIKEGNYFKASTGPCATGLPLQSRIYTAYNIHQAEEIVKSDLNKFSDIPSGMDNIFSITGLPDGNKELVISLKEPVFVQCYFMDDTNEILAKLIRQTLGPGQYNLRLNDEKLKNRNVKLNIHLGDTKQSLSIN